MSESFRTVNQYIMYFSGSNMIHITDMDIYFSFLGFLYYLSSTLNPLLYTILSVKYRESFKKVILCKNPRYLMLLSSLSSFSLIFTKIMNAVIENIITVREHFYVFKMLKRAC